MNRTQLMVALVWIAVFSSPFIAIHYFGLVNFLIFSAACIAGMGVLILIDSIIKNARIMRQREIEADLMAN